MVGPIQSHQPPTTAATRRLTRDGEQWLGIGHGQTITTTLVGSRLANVTFFLCVFSSCFAVLSVTCLIKLILAYFLIYFIPFLLHVSHDATMPITGRMQLACLLVLSLIYHHYPHPSIASSRRQIKYSMLSVNLLCTNIVYISQVVSSGIGPI